MFRRLFAPLLALAVAGPASAQLAPDKALASLKVADGLQVELFASEPMLVNPTSIDVDHKGRVWVCEAVNYRRLKFNRPILRPEGDRIVVLVDKDGDGKADDAVTFYQGKEIVAPLGVCIAPTADGKGQRVFVCQSPDLLVFDDLDGDLKADGPPKKLLTGVGSFDHDHGIHGVNIGPDGKLYFTVGDTGVHNLQASDGKGPKFNSNNTDCRAGTVWRCDQDGKNLELIAHNFRNNYEACVNSFGEVWLSDNDDDGNQQTRICHVMPGGNYGYHPRGPGQTHWHEEQPGIVHKTLRTGFGSPTGICFYEGNLLPEKYRGQLLHCDAGPREVRCFHIKPKGAGYELDKEVILTSSDTWHRVSDVCVGPDGSVFVADWYDPGVGGHGMGDWTRGRIYRITPAGHKGYKFPEAKTDTKEGVLAALGSPCLATRAMAIAALAKMPPIEAVKLVAGSVTKDTTVAEKARIVWLCMWFGKNDWPPPAMEKLIGITHEDDRLEVILVRAQELFESKSPAEFADEMLPPEIAKKMSPALARELLLTIRGGPTTNRGEARGTGWRLDGAKNVFYPLAKLYDGKDIFYRAALSIACGTDPARRDTILADFDKHFPEWNDTVADLVWELRPKSVLPRLEKLVADGKLSDAQRGRIVDILAASDDPAAGRAMLGLLAADAPAEVKARAIDNLRQFLPGKWNALAKSPDLKAAITSLLGGEKSRATGLQLVAAAGFTMAIEDVEKIGADDKQPLDVRLEAVRALGQLKDAKAVDALLRLGQPTNPLSVPVVQALGQHLSTGPKPTEASLRAMDALETAVTLEKAGPEIKAAALAALTGSRSGTAWLLQLKEKGKMPADVQAEAGRLLRNSPFQGERNKAMLLFPAPGKLDPKKLPAPAVLAKRTGSAANGKVILAKSAANEVSCLRCHMVRGAGGQIGPDLSMIGKKGSRENLFESILLPSKAIADQYVSWTIDTAAGQTITGLLVSETDKVVTLRDANGKDYPIDVKEIDKRTKSLVSLMPDNLAAALTEDELVDLVEYLTTLQTASLTPDAWQVAGPFPTDGTDAAADKVFGPEKGPFDPKAKFPANGGGKEVGWQPVRPAANGYVDLAALHGTAATNSASYAYASVESPADQEATVLLGTDDAGQLWVNGESVAKTKGGVAAAPETDRATVKLKKGANALLLKVANGSNPHGFYLTLLSGQELKLAK